MHNRQENRTPTPPPKRAKEVHSGVSATTPAGPRHTNSSHKQDRRTIKPIRSDGEAALALIERNTLPAANTAHAALPYSVRSVCRGYRVIGHIQKKTVTEPIDANGHHIAIDPNQRK